MLLSRLNQIVLIILLVTIFNEGMAMNREGCTPLTIKDSLFLPPLKKYVGKEVESLLVEINPGSYEKFYIDTPQGLLAGIIIQFKDSGASMYIYFDKAKPVIDSAINRDWERIKKERIFCIEVYRDSEFIKLFEG